MIRRSRRQASRRREARTCRGRGQSLVEFALILPLFLLILLGMIDFGFAFYTNLTIEYASREGARVGAALAAGNTLFPCDKVDSYVMAAVQRVLESAGIAVDINRAGSGGVNWVRIYKSTDANGNGYATGGNYNQWTYSAGSGPTVDGRVLDFVGPTESAASWKACTRNNGATPDSLGVAISYTYGWITPVAQVPRTLGLGSFGQLSWVDKTVMALNPTTP